jgi:hypothetical protein
MSDRIFQVEHPHMKGSDVGVAKGRQEALQAKMKIRLPDQGGRRLWHRLLDPSQRRWFTPTECRSRADAAASLRSFDPSCVTHQIAQRGREDREVPLPITVKYRAQLRKRWGAATSVAVHSPTTVIVEDTWGFHPGVHDGLDVITPPDPVIFAMIKAKVIDVRSEGWWNLGAPKDPQLKAKGDGIIQLEDPRERRPLQEGLCTSATATLRRRWSTSVRSFDAGSSHRSRRLCQRVAYSPDGQQR